MKAYHVTIRVVEEHLVYVEAESEEEARSKAITLINTDPLSALEYWESSPEVEMVEEVKSR